MMKDIAQTLVSLTNEVVAHCSSTECLKKVQTHFHLITVLQNGRQVVRAGSSKAFRSKRDAMQTIFGSTNCSQILELEKSYFEKARLTMRFMALQNAVDAGILPETNSDVDVPTIERGHDGQIIEGWDAESIAVITPEAYSAISEMINAL